MKLTLVLPETKASSPSKAFEEKYRKLLQNYVKAEVKTYKPEKNGSTEHKKKTDQNKVHSLIPKDSVLIALDERGLSLTTRELLKVMEKESMNSTQAHICLVVGGPFGLTDDFKKASKKVVRLSPLTFNSEVAISVLWEQLYRIFSLKHGHPYHND